MRTILGLELILVNLLLRSAQCTLDDGQYPISMDEVNAARNELLPTGEEDIHASSISNIDELVSISGIYNTLGFESSESFPLNLEDIAVHDPNAASLSENADTASTQVDNGYKAYSYDIDALQDDKIIPTIASGETKVSAADGSLKYLTVDSKPEASIANKPVRQPIAPALNKRKVPKVKNKQTMAAINNQVVTPVINKRGVAAVINNNPEVPAPLINNNQEEPAPVINSNSPSPAENKEAFVSVAHYKPIASAIKNMPIPSTVNDSPTISVNVHGPTTIASVIQQSPAPYVNINNPTMSAIQQESAPVASAVQQAPAAVSAFIELNINSTAEEQGHRCYEDNRKVAFSQYWIPRQNEWDETNEGNRVFLGGNILRRMNDKNGGELGWIPVEMYEKCKMEGTCLLVNGDLVNIDSSTDTFVKVGGLGRRNNVFGLGSGSQNLVPFISVAANDLPLGQKLYIPELDGVHLGGGMFHNGCVRVDDHSWSFGTCQIDFFVLSYVDYLWLHLGEQVSVRTEECQLKNYINKYHLAMMKANIDENIIPSLLDAKYVPQ